MAPPLGCSPLFWPLRSPSSEWADHHHHQMTDKTVAWRREVTVLRFKVAVLRRQSWVLLMGPREYPALASSCGDQASLLWKATASLLPSFPHGPYNYFAFSLKLWTSSVMPIHSWCPCFVLHQIQPSYLLLCHSSLLWPPWPTSKYPCPRSSLTLVFWILPHLLKNFPPSPFLYFSCSNDIFSLLHHSLQYLNRV